jgi:hypothetical protein
MLAAAAHAMFTGDEAPDVFVWTREHAPNLTAERVDTIVSLMQILKWKAADFVQDFMSSTASDACLIGTLNRIAKQCPRPVDADLPTPPPVTSRARVPEILGDPPLSPSAWSQESGGHRQLQRQAVPDPFAVMGHFSPGPALTRDDKLILNATTRRLKEEAVIKKAARTYNITEDYVRGLIEADDLPPGAIKPPAKSTVNPPGSQLSESSRKPFENQKQSADHRSSSRSQDRGHGKSESRHRSRSRDRYAGQQPQRYFRGLQGYQPRGNYRGNNSSRCQQPAGRSSQSHRSGDGWKRSRSRSRSRDVEKRRDRRRTPSPGRASAASNQDARIDRLQATVDALAAAVKDHVLPKTR